MLYVGSVTDGNSHHKIAHAQRSWPCVQELKDEMRVSMPTKKLMVGIVHKLAMWRPQNSIPDMRPLSLPMTSSSITVKVLCRRSKRRRASMCPKRCY